MSPTSQSKQANQTGKPNRQSKQASQTSNQNKQAKQPRKTSNPKKQSKQHIKKSPGIRFPTLSAARVSLPRRKQLLLAPTYVSLFMHVCHDCHVPRTCPCVIVQPRDNLNRASFSNLFEISSVRIV